MMVPPHPLSLMPRRRTKENRMKFRKKPVVIEAEMFSDTKPDLSVPAGVCVDMCGPHGIENRPHIHTLEGPMLVSNGDWIITGVKGEKYPCKPDIFALTYEAVEAPAEPKEGGRP